MKPFSVLSEHEEYRDGKRFSVMRAKLKTPEDKEVAWAYIKAGDGVIVVALDDAQNIYIKREWRLNRRDFVWELPSGWIEAENPAEKDILEAANRELQEEIGVAAGKLSIIRSFYVMNHSTSKFHVVLATQLSASKLNGDEHEHLEMKKVPFAEAETTLLEKQIPSAQILIALEAAKKYIK